MSITNSTAVALVRVIHLALIAYVLFYPFVGTIMVTHVTGTGLADNNTIFIARRNLHVLLEILYLVSCVSLLSHWYWNDDTCILTMLEARLRGQKVNEGFIYSIISPVYKFPKNTFRRFTQFAILFNMATVAARLCRSGASVLAPIVII